MDYAPISAWTAFIVACLIICFGVFATVLPVLPGTLIVWLGVLVHRLWMGEDSVSWPFVGVAFLLVVVAQVFDTILSIWGAKSFGSTWKGALGGIVGGLVGIFLGPMGMLVGTIVGAVLFEWIELRNSGRAAQAGLGTIFGIISLLKKSRHAPQQALCACQQGGITGGWVHDPARDANAAGGAKRCCPWGCSLGRLPWRKLWTAGQ
jgi:hypothetical protein